MLVGWVCGCVVGWVCGRVGGRVVGMVSLTGSGWSVQSKMFTVWIGVIVSILYSVVTTCLAI